MSGNRLQNYALLSILASLLVFCAGCDDDDRPQAVSDVVEETETPSDRIPDSAIPPRPPGALTGTEFLALTAGWSIPDREEEILAQIKSGNIPEFLRTFLPVTASFTDSAGVVHTVSFQVMPDYLAIGSDEDFVRMPMGSRTAQKIADAFECSLVTRQMVDDIWTHASVKLSPIPMTPSAEMLSNEYFGTHQQLIETARAGYPLGALTAGIKKDVVLSNKLLTKPYSVAIYGWHYLSGTPIQPLSTVHYHTYADYSHGIRLVDQTVIVDGEPMLITDVLKSASLHDLLSDEGVMPDPRIPGVAPPGP